MATTKNIYVTGSGLRATVSTPVINVAYENTGIATRVNQYGVQVTQPPDVEVNVQGSGIGGGPIPDRVTNIGLNGDDVIYSIFFTFPQISIAGQYAHVGDSYKAFSIGKGFSEDKIISEQLGIQISTPKADTTTVADTFAKTYIKPVIETVLRTDTTKISANKNIISLAGTTETTKTSVQKIFLESKQITERVLLVANFRRNFFDYLDATDDFYGEANVDDDQTARFTKSVIEYLNLLDLATNKVAATKLEQSSVADSASINTAKVLSDDINKSDRFSISFQKPAVELTSVSDLQTLAARKGLEDSTGTIEQRKFDINKPFIEIADFGDTSSINTTKPFFDDIINQDTFEYAWSAIRNPVEQIFNSDTNTVDIASVKADIVALMDTISLLVKRNHFALDEFLVSDSVYTQVTYNRLFTDYIDATDELFGEFAGVDDGQTARFTKSVIEYPVTTDLASADVSVTKYDEYTADDATYIQINKPFTESVVNADTSSLGFKKPVVELVNIVLDTPYISTEKSVNENVVGIEQINLVFNKPFTESKTLSDTNSISTTKTLSESIINQDTFEYAWSALRNPVEQVFNRDTNKVDIASVKADIAALMDTINLMLSRRFTALDTFFTSDTLSTQVSYNRLFTDYIDATDDFYGLANVDDDQTARFTKALIDYPTTYDNISFDNSKTIQDESFTTPDSAAITLSKPFTSNFTKYDQTTLLTNKGVISTTSNVDYNMKRSTKVSSDAFNTADSSSRAAYSVQIDITHTSDTIEKFSVNKVTLDTGTILDAPAITAYPVLRNITETQDYQVLLVNKQPVDGLITSEDKYFQAYKSQIDTLSIKNADSVANATSKPLADAYSNILDVAANKPSIVKSDYTSISETQIQLVTNYFRSYSDTVDATDDFYGLANIDDDQVARLDKRVIDYANTADIKSAYTTTVKLDTVAGTDTPYKQPRKVISDSYSTSDVLTYDKITNKPLLEVSDVSDSVYINWQDYCEPNIFELTYVGQERFLSYN